MHFDLPSEGQNTLPALNVLLCSSFHSFKTESEKLAIVAERIHVV